MFLLLAVLGYLFLAVAYMFDKFILTKSVSRPVVYGFYSTVFLLASIVFVPFGVRALSGIDWVWAIVSGVTFGVAVLTIFFALRHGEATHVNPFNGAVVTLATYALSTVFFHEVLTLAQKIGVTLLVFACLLLSWQKTSVKTNAFLTFFWATVSGVSFAISHVTAKYVYSLYPFLTGFVWTRFFTGLFGLLLLFHPAVRHVFRKRTHEPKTEAKRHVFSLVVVGKTCAVVSTVLIQYAIALGSATIVNALAGLQFLFMFVLVYTLTRFKPSVFHEYFTKKEIKIELMAIFCIIFGSVCMLL